MIATIPKVLTAEEYFLLPESEASKHSELVRGEIVEMSSPGFRHGEVQLAIGSILRSFVKKRKLGRVAVESGTITERDPDTVRGPDVSFYGKARLPLDVEVVTYHTTTPDLCVEVVSPSNTRQELLDKAEEYLNAGVQSVWIVDPEAETATVILPGKKPKVFSSDATLESDVLPGFSCKVSEFFE